MRSSGSLTSGGSGAGVQDGKPYVLADPDETSVVVKGPGDHEPETDPVALEAKHIDTQNDSKASHAAPPKMAAVVDEEELAVATTTTSARNRLTTNATVNANTQMLTAQSLIGPPSSLQTSSIPDAAPPVDPMRPLLTVAAQIIHAVLGPILDQAPLTPTPDTPILWAVLSWVRRQVDQYLPQTTVVASSSPLLAQVAPVDGDVVLPAAADVTGQDGGTGVHPPVSLGDGELTGLPDDFDRTLLVSGLVQPTDFRFLPDGDILIAEKGGAIKLYHDGHVHDDPVITLATLPTDTDEERGLLGIEIDPDFEHNGYIYASYTTAQNFDRLSRFTVTGETANPASELVLLESDQPGNVYHHGGEIHFGPDGKLYWAMGMNTNNTNSQNLANVHGKILRLNPDGTVPDDNPFLDTPGAVPDIWAYGLRNPFRFTFTPNGKLLAGDVGGSAFEELDIVTAGANYGWPSAEGYCSTCGYANPVYTYAHTADAAHAGSITAVMVYTGDTFGNEYQNKVFIADYTLGFIKELTFDSDFDSFISEKMFDDNAGTTVKLAQGPDGNIYQLNIFPGELSVIRPSGGNRAPAAVIAASASSGLGPLTVNFSGSRSSDPDPNTTLGYLWNFGDGSTSTLMSPTRTYTVNGAYNVTLTVSDGEKTNTATQRIVVGSTMPTAQIVTPSNDSRYNAGDVISFSGIGTDAEDGVLPDSAYRWTVVFQHADHIHPFRSDIVGPTGSITIPRGADNIDTTSYRLTLTVTDSSGLSSSDTIEVKPNLVDLTFNSNDPDAVYTIDGIPFKGTHTERAVVGVERVLGAPSPQYVDDGQFVFGSWSDGLAQTHTIVTPGANTSYGVTFTALDVPPAPWQQGDIGRPTAAGYSSYDNGVFTVHGAGNDIWDKTDQFHYVYQPFSGDGTIIARATSQTDTDGWAKSGVIIKESTAPGSKYVLLAVTPDHGITFQYNYNGDGGSAPYTLPDGWLKLQREGDVFSGYASTNGTDWTLVGRTTLAMSASATAGLAVNSHEFSTLLSTTTFDHVSVSDSSAPPTTLPSPWTGADVGVPQLTGSSSYAGGVFTVNGGGNDIWADADQFHFTSQTLSGDGEIVARVTGQENTSDWAKSGLMIKQSAAAGSPYALLAVTPGHGAVLQSGFNTSIQSATTAQTSWLKLKRAGDTITGYASADGVTWNQIGSTTVALGNSALVGLFVTSHDGGQLNTTTFDKVSVVKANQWTSRDIGAPTLAGNTAVTGGTYTLNGGGNDIWADADQFHYSYQSLVGDGEIVARVTGQENTSDWAKSGLMIKQSSAAGAPYVLLAVTPAHGTVLQSGFNTNVGGAVVTPPNAWLKLKRVGDTVTGYTSADGVTWTEVGSATVALGDTALAGLFVTSHDGAQLNTSTFDHVSLSASSAPPVTLPSPWAAADIGAPQLKGSSTFAGGVFTVNGGGNDIWADADQLQFVSQTLSGDGDIVARVTGQENTSDSAKSGLMIKQSAAAGSPYALLAVTPGHGTVLQSNFNSSVGGAVAASPNTWLKLTRAGNAVTGYTSTDGQVWTQIGSTTVTLGSSVLVGLFVTSHEGGQLNTTTFDHVSVVPKVAALSA
ncbi:PQQ-dependent sugar dehydrogenase [Mycobacterium sp. NPDC006124]|uniref:PQQ-dependent sugar dehydrogenase n=1 Tax=Mycobacterium sp. NPDC006124 TaxID=3156729 RepID=UPI0033A28EC3